MLEFFDQMSGLQQQLLLVDQLRREAAIKRINVGQAVEDLKVLNKDMTVSPEQPSLCFRSTWVRTSRKTTCSWASLHRSQIHSGRSRLVIFCRTSKPKKDKDYVQSLIGFFGQWQVFSKVVRQGLRPKTHRCRTSRTVEYDRNPLDHYLSYFTLEDKGYSEGWTGWGGALV